MRKMPIVWNVLCNTSGDRCLLGGVKFLIVPSSEYQLAPRQCDFTDILRMTRWRASFLTVDVWTECFCYHPFHTLKYSRFIKPRRYSHKRAPYYFPRVTAKESKNKIPSLLLGCKHFMLLCDFTSQEIPGEAWQAGRRPGSKTSRFWTCVWRALMISCVISNGAERKEAQMSRRRCCWI